MIGRLGLLLMLISGCSSQHQQGKYAVAATEVRRLGLVSGYAVSYHGSALGRAHDPIGGQQTLFVAALFSPAGSIEKFKAEHTHGEDVSATYLRWQTNAEHSVEIEWNRSKDLIRIGDLQFDRSKGRVLLLVQTAENGLDCLQLADEAAAGDPEAAVKKWLDLGDADELVIKRGNIE